MAWRSAFFRPKKIAAVDIVSGTRHFVPLALRKESAKFNLKWIFQGPSLGAIVIGDEL